MGRLGNLLRHSSVYAFGSILARGINFLLLPVFTNYLSPEDYGVIALLFLLLAGAGILFNLGLNDAFLRYFVLASDEQERKQVFRNAYGCGLGLTMVSALLVFVFADPVARALLGSSAYRTQLQLCAGILILEGLCGMPFLILRARGQSGKFVLLKAANAAVSLGASVVMVAFLGWRTAGVLLAQILSLVITLLFLVPVLRQWWGGSIQRNTLLDLLRFGVAFVLPGISFVFLDSVDRYLLERLTDLQTVGVYSAGYRLGMLMALVVGAFESAWVPFFLNTAGHEGAEETFSRVFTYLTAALMALFLLLTFFVGDLAGLRVMGVRFLGGEYAAGLGIVPWILASYLCYGVYVFFLGPIYLQRKTGYLSLILPLAVAANIVLNLLWIPRWNMAGAAWSTFAGYGLLALLLYFVSRRVYPLSLQWVRIGKVALAGSLVLVGWSLLHFPDHLWTKTGFLVGFPLLLVVQGFFNEGEWGKLVSLVGRRG